MSTFSKKTAPAAATKASSYFYKSLGATTPHTYAYESSATTGGPWSHKLQHGGPPSALMTAAAERFLAQESIDGAVRRATVLFFRPVPVAPVFVDVRPLRVGAKVAHVEVSLYTDEQREKEAMRATILAMPQRNVDGVPELPEKLRQHPVPPPLGGFDTAADTGNAGKNHGHFGAFPFFQELTIRPPGARPQAIGKGPMAMWFATRTPLIDGQGPMSPAAQILLTADSAGGMSYYVDARGYTFVNSDTTVNIMRTPKRATAEQGTDSVNGWFLMDAKTRLTPEEGTGLAQAELHDSQGLCATVSQTQVLEKIVPRAK